MYNAGIHTQIHNLSRTLTIPIEFKAILSLGMKFVFPQKPSFKKIRESVNETCRKAAWNTYFKLNPDNKEKTELKSWYISCQKESRKIMKTTGPPCPIQSNLFNLSKLTRNLFKSLKYYEDKNYSLLINTVTRFKKWCEDNQVLIVESDKNAGICIVNKLDYENEILRQLQDTSSYFPSTQTHFDNACIEFLDKQKVFQKCLPKEIKLSSLLSSNNPANFYILPKVHKQFENFPKGRPISSTYSKVNKFCSKLLDFVLKPCLMNVNDLLLDTQHFLILLEHLKLPPDKKYVLTTIDVEALYPSLKLSDCKKHCIEAYETFKQLKNPAFCLSKQQFSSLMSLSLDYSYVTYKDQYFYQHRGIEMGNAASVAVANITVFKEVANLLEGKEEIAFYKRFLDDIFVILQVDNIENVSGWLEDALRHDYLKFTYEINEKCINFLDVCINLEKNNQLHTSLYVKPMNKHVYLHAQSNHPNHLKKSLFWSQGLRLVRIHSKWENRVSSLKEMYLKFLSRGYCHKNLYLTFILLCQYKREKALCPKKQLLIDYLLQHSPDILSKYNISNDAILTEKDNDSIYAVFPFYSNIHKYRDTISRCFTEELHSSSTEDYKELIRNISIKVVFSRIKNLKEMFK